MYHRPLPSSHLLSVPPQPSRGRVRREGAEGYLLRHGPRARERLEPKADRREAVARNPPHRAGRARAVREVDERRHDGLRVGKGDDRPGLRGEVHEGADGGELLVVLLPHGRGGEEAEHGLRGESDLGRRVRAEVLDGADRPHPVLGELAPSRGQEGVDRVLVRRKEGVVAREPSEVAHHLEAPRVERIVEDARQEHDAPQELAVPAHGPRVRAVLAQVGQRRARRQLAPREEVRRVLDVELLEARDLHLDSLLLDRLGVRQVELRLVHAVAVAVVVVVVPVRTAAASPPTPSAVVARVVVVHVTPLVRRPRVVRHVVLLLVRVPSPGPFGERSRVHPHHALVRLVVERVERATLVVRRRPVRVA
ncbi:hypothetical protein THAOC_05843, partial [Thalassiosira oceanica]